MTVCSVMIVDPDADFALPLARLLRDRGHAAYRVATVALARRAMAMTVPHVVVLTTALPDGSGLDLLREIRDDDRTAGAKVVV